MKKVRMKFEDPTNMMTVSMRVAVSNNEAFEFHVINEHGQPFLSSKLVIFKVTILVRYSHFVF